MPFSSAGRARAAGLLVIGILIGAALVAVPAMTSGLWPTPADESAEAGFARDMAVHHAQAIEMAFMVRDASNDPALRTLAYDIIATQGAQRGMFMGWLQQWGLSQSGSGPLMAWMPGHGGGAVSGSGRHAPMHGMASPEELERLRAAEGVDAEILFLQLMIRHHEGGVLMARAVLPLTRRDDVRSMARSIDESQLGEIRLMKEMLAARGAAPLPSLLQ